MMTDNEYKKIKKMADENETIILIYKNGKPTAISDLNLLPYCGTTLKDYLESTENTFKKALEEEINARKEAEKKIIEIISRLNKGGK